jgi:PAS domain S-box-containing protein
MNESKIIDYASLVPEYLQNSDKFYALITDMNGDYAYVNNYFKQRFGFITNDFIGKPSSIAIYSEDNGICTAAVNKLMQSPYAIVPVTVRKPSNNDGDFFWSNWEFSFVWNKDKQPIGVMCIGVDVTEVEKLEQKNEVISSEINTIINSMQDAYFSLNTHWIYTLVNQKYLDFLGKKEEEVLGKSFWTVFIKSESENCYNAFLKVMNGGDSSQIEDYYPEIQKHLNAFAYSTPKGMNVLLFDVTKQKNYQRKIEEQNVTLEKALSENKVFGEIINQLAIVSKTDLRGNITYANEQFLKWSKYTKEEIIGKNHRVLKSGKQDNVLFDNLWKTISSGSIFRGEILNKDKEGGYYWVDTIIAPVLNNFGVPKEYFAIRFVINERKENEYKMKEQNNKLKQIAWQHSHELRRPLANIKGLIQVLEMEYKESIDADLIHNILLSTNELDEIVHKITNVSINE